MSVFLRLGTRGSLLARTQSQLVAAAIEKANPGARVELVIIRTTGDQVQDQPLADLGGKGLFTRELEQALLRDEIDLAVHSYKDVPVTMPLVDQSRLTIACVPRREDARDVLIGRAGACELKSLPHDAKVGTGSPRRHSQLIDLRPDLRVEPIRGNIDTRLRKLRDGDFDAIVLALAGLKRTGLFDATYMSILPVEQFTPAAGQGALALQGRRDDARLLELLQPLHDPAAARCVALERRLIELLNGDCHSPIAAHAVIEADQLIFHAALGFPGGAPLRRVTRSAEIPHADHLPDEVAQALLD